MKKIFFCLLASAFLLSSCGDDDTPDVTPSNRGTVVDDQGNTYNYVQIGSLLWTTSNAQNGASLADLTYFNGWSYADAFDEDGKADLRENYFPVYGNLMTYAEAVNSAPAGWRLPTDEDWQQLERSLGMTGTDSKGWRGSDTAFKLQMEGEGCELALRLGGACTWKAVYGWMELEQDHVKEYGFYWTSTIEPSYTDQEEAYYRKIAANIGSVDRECTTTDKLMSVRWVKDAE